MTTTETETPSEATEAPPGGEPPADDTPVAELEPAPKPRDEALWTRVLLPLGLPILSTIAVAVWVVNLSRVFIASGKDGALVVVVIVTVAIMLGASLISAAKHMREASQTMVVVGLISVIIAGGFITFGPSEGHEGGGAAYKEPKGPPDSTISPDAGPGYTFGKDEFTATAGVVEIDFIDKGVAHTLKFADPKLSNVPVMTNGEKQKVKLAAGNYTIYCTLPGHRSGGMEATVTVE